MRKIALFGNPNTGKSSLFNRLTGLKQRVGNFPGVTVDKQSAQIELDSEIVEIIDFPGTYSIFPRSKDEKVVYDVVSNENHVDFPDIAVVVVDAANLERNLLLYLQLRECGLPTILAVNMVDMAAKKGVTIHYDRLQQAFPDATVVKLNARVGFGVEQLKNAIVQFKGEKQAFRLTVGLEDSEGQIRDTELKYENIRLIIANCVETFDPFPNNKEKFKLGIDKWLTHRVWGYALFAFTLLVLFQLVFSIASYPMDWIDNAFSNLAAFLGASLPDGLLTRLLVEGIVPGIGGVIIFIPQISLLFFLLGILEETGYMARVVFIMDKLMRPFGLNGKSVVPLISSAACAIPGVMATRTIQSWKERIITILVAPLMSCSARIPVYTLLIALVVPEKTVFGFIQLQGLVLFALYGLGLFTALAVAWLLKWILNSKDTSVFLLELPPYRSPRWANVGIEMFQKVRIFVIDAGKIILAISILLWALASFGPGNKMEEAAEKMKSAGSYGNQNQEEFDRELASVKLENSYIGHFGKWIEPAIRPLGYDWKIGVSLITSFAAREVFVGSMATIYSVHQESDDPAPLIDRMRTETNSEGKPMYSIAVGASLLVFYVYAMQCMATLAVVRRETKSWKWPIIQVVYMGVLAYLGAFIAFNVFV